MVRVMVFRIHHLHDVVCALHGQSNNLVAVENSIYPTAHSRSMGPFGYLFEQASLTKVSLSGEQTSSMFLPFVRT